MGGDAWGRKAAVGACLAVLVVSAGCGALTGSEPLVFTASNASIDPAVLSETPYALQEAENTTVERSVEVGGQTRTLGTEATVTRYAATPSDGGTSAEVSVLLLRVSHEGDYVIAAVTYPRALEDGRADALTLLRNIEH